MDKLILFIKENIRLILGAAVVIFIFLLLLTLLLTHKSTKVKVAGQTFSVSVARTDKEKQIGLSGKNSLPKNQGMLFVFDQPEFYSFWMKNMKFPIDIIYIHGNKVTTVIKNAKPVQDSDLPIYQPRERSDRVLEINAGLSDQYGIKNGSEVKYNNL